MIIRMVLRGTTSRNKFPTIPPFPPGSSSPPLPLLSTNRKMSKRYFTSPANKLAIYGELRPKSKFLGNSAATIMEGASYAYFLDRPEDGEYHITMPNMYVFPSSPLKGWNWFRNKVREGNFIWQGQFIVIVFTILLLWTGLMEMVIRWYWSWGILVWSRMRLMDFRASWNSRQKYVISSSSSSSFPSSSFPSPFHSR